MAQFDSLVYWVIFVVVIFVVVATAFISCIVACFRPCCVTRTVKDPEGDNLISKSMQTDELPTPTPPEEEEEEDDLIVVTKHANSTFSIDRRKSSVSALKTIDRRASIFPPETVFNTDRRPISTINENGVENKTQQPPPVYPYQPYQYPPPGMLPPIMPPATPMLPPITPMMYNPMMPQSAFANPYPMY